MAAKSNLAAVEKRLKKFSEKDVPAAQATAIRKTLALAKTRLVRAVAEDAAVRVGLVRKRVYQPKRRKGRAQALVAYASGIPLIQMRPRAVPGGVQAGQYLVPDGFIATPTSRPVGDLRGRTAPGPGLVGRQQVFARQRRSRYPLRMQAVEIRQYVKKHLRFQTGRMVNERYPGLLQHELQRRAAKK